MEWELVEAGFKFAESRIIYENVQEDQKELLVQIDQIREVKGSEVKFKLGNMLTMQ